MDLQGNTILITGGGSGIGRGLAEALHRAGNTIVIAGRRQRALDEVTAASPGIHAMPLDVASPDAIRAFAAAVKAAFPALNERVNNAGVSRFESAVANPTDTDTAEATVNTNLLGPIRLTAALLPHLMARPSATIINVTSGLAFVPFTVAPTYSATKAALHSYTVSLRSQLRATNVSVLELPPPYVQTELGGAWQATDPRAMPLQAFVDEVMTLLPAPPASGELLVEHVKPARHAERDGKFDELFGMLTAMGEQMAAGR